MNTDTTKTHTHAERVEICNTLMQLIGLDGVTGDEIETIFTAIDIICPDYKDVLDKWQNGATNEAERFVNAEQQRRALVKEIKGGKVVDLAALKEAETPHEYGELPHD